MAILALLRVGCKSFSGEIESSNIGGRGFIEIIGRDVLISRLLILKGRCCGGLGDNNGLRVSPELAAPESSTSEIA